ncbi:UvrD-helicase domain-containing protein [Limnobacter sp.]|uniref:UvrD-helicase domain-containing protein n=1 Tax=Limnobacter sp. TaxID=2003368 RepID=UPI003515AA05
MNLPPNSLNNNARMAFTATACNPANSVVVEACAGSGKTWLLTARLFRLLLAGAKPEHILAITFTRKAAEEMQTRLYDLLRECACASPTRLQELLSERAAPVDAATLAKARALAGEVLTSPRGVTINTFHGWFTSLCQLAPLSSGFSRQSEPTEQTQFWMDQAIEHLTRKALQLEVDQPQLASAFNTLAKLLGREGQHKVLKDALQNRVACMLALLNPNAPGLLDVFQVDPAQRWPVALLDDVQWLAQCRQIAVDLGLGTAAQQRAANELEALCSEVGAGGDAEQQFNVFFDFFLKSDGAPRVGSPFKVTKDQTGNPRFDEVRWTQSLQAVQLNLRTARQRQHDQEDLECTEALRQLQPALFEVYQQLKREQGLCDFDDLEATALQLMMDDEQRAYMLQKLDARVRHVLLDEFQDTNPVQWNILRHWLEDYGDAERPSVFLVGDPKQSIYRFRRAESRLFEQAKQWLKQHFQAHDLYSDETRRCAHGVVEVVNAVFAPGQLRGNTPFRPHTSLAAPAQHAWPALALYPLVEKESPLSEATLCVHTLQQWLNSGRIEGLHQVMVLVQAHSSVPPLTRALREANLPYTVKDKGERYSSVVWADTLALLRFLDEPTNTMALLHVLRSPLLGLKVGQVQQLIHAGHALQSPHAWHTLCALAQAADPPWAVSVQALLQGWLHSAKAMPLFETLSLVVQQSEAMQRYLNAAAPRERKLFSEHWDWLKAWALGVDKGRFPSLGKAIEQAERLALYEGSDGEGEAPSPGVLRIMTVHSAKGLEADHVWLLDANRTAEGMGSPAGLLLDWPLEDRVPRAVTVMGNTRRPSLGRTAVQALDEQAYLDEEDHLLYVALTRARLSVHVSGRQGGKGAGRAWYARLLPHVPGVSEWPAVQGDVAVAQALDDAPAVWTRPAWPVVQALEAPVGQVLPRLHSPELRMGTAWHAALEHVDALATTEFETWWAERLLDCEAVFLPLAEDELQQVKSACHTVLSKAELHPYLQHAEQAWNELEWTLPNGRFLRADRVVYTQGQWWVLDYKWAVNAHNLPEYTQQVLEYVALVDQTLRLGTAPGTPAGPTRAALIDRHGEMHRLSSV